MFFLALIFLSLVFILIKSLDNLSNNLLQLPAIPDVTASTTTLQSHQVPINRSGGDAAQCQDSFLPEVEGLSQSNTSVISDREAPTKTNTDLKCKRLDSAGEVFVTPLNTNNVSSTLKSSFHALDDQYCTESMTDTSEASGNHEDQLPEDRSHDNSLSSSNRVNRSVSNIEISISIKEREDDSHDNLQSKDTSNNIDRSSALESLKRMQVICSEMRDALRSSQLGSYRCTDTCDLSGYKNSYGKNLDCLDSKSSLSFDSLYSESSVDTVIHCQQYTTDSINPPDTKINDEIQQQENTHDEINELKTTNSYSTEEEKRVMEIEQTIQTYEPTGDFDLEQSHSITRNNSEGLVDQIVEVIEKLEDASEQRNDSNIELDKIDNIDDKIEILKKLERECRHENRSGIKFGNNDKSQITNGNEPTKTKSFDESGIMPQDSNKLVGEVKNRTITESDGNNTCTANDDGIIIEQKSSIDPSESMVHLKSPSTISMYEMDEFLFWERLKDVIARCHKNGQKYAKNILDYYSSNANIGRKYEDYDIRAYKNNMETALNVFNLKREEKRNRIEFSSEISQYILGENSFPRYIFEQESMNLSLEPLVVFFGEVHVTGAFRQVLMEEDKINKKSDPVTPDETINVVDENITRAMSLETLQSDQRYNNFTGSTVGSEVCGRSVCYDSSFHSIDTAITPTDKGDKNKKKFEKYYSVYKKFENSEH